MLCAVEWLGLVQLNHLQVVAQADNSMDASALATSVLPSIATLPPLRPPGAKPDGKPSFHSCFAALRPIVGKLIEVCSELRQTICAEGVMRCRREL